MGSRAAVLCRSALVEVSPTSRLYEVVQSSVARAHTIQTNNRWPILRRYEVGDEVQVSDGRSDMRSGG